MLLNFHTQAIALGGELEWTSEATRQLGYGREELAKSFSDMRKAVRVSQSRLDPTGKSALAALTAAGDMKDGLATVLREHGFDRAPLLVVITAFEEVTCQSFPANDEALPLTLFGRALLWADSLATLKTNDAKPVFSAVRVIVCGREKPDLDQERLARWFVAHRVIGAQPAAAAKGAAEAPGVELSSETTAVLFVRMLKRLSSAPGLPDGVTAEMNQTVAFSSLALRTITPDLLHDVVAPAAGFDSVSASQAKALFDRLAAEVWLVTKRPNEDVAQPRPDIRRVMLSMRGGPSEQQSAAGAMSEWALRVHRNAADWYARRAPKDEAAKLEAAYHRAFLPELFAAWLGEFAPGEVPRLCRHLADSAENDLPLMPLTARALLRFYSVGPLRMTAEELAALPPELAGKADVERLEFARREGRDVTTAAPPASPSGISVRGARPPPVIAEAAAVVGAEAPSPGYRLYELLNDRDLGARIRYAFSVGDFDEAAGLAWTAIHTVPQLPDLSDPLRSADDPVMHWIWMAALARLVSGDQWPPSGQIESLMSRVIGSTNPERASTNPVGLWLAAAATIALEGRLSSVASTEKLISLIRRVQSAVMHADLRVFALYPLWLGDRRPSTPMQISVPLNRLQVFRREFLSDTPAVPGLGSVSRLLKRMIDQKTLSRDIDVYAAASEPSVLFHEPAWGKSAERVKIGRMLTGLQPELYDVAVLAVREVDRKNRDWVDQAIRETEAQALYWPADAKADENPAVRDRDRRAGLLARAVVHADRCGLLPELLQKVTAQSDNRRLIQISKLAVRYAEVLRQGWISEAAQSTSQDMLTAPAIVELTAPAIIKSAAPAIISISDDHEHQDVRDAMNRNDQTISRDESRRAHNEEFIQRLLARRPQMRQKYNDRVKEVAAQQTPQIIAETAIPGPEAETLGLPVRTVPEIVAETIVFEERPVLFVKNDWIDPVNVTKKGEEAEELVKDLETRRATIEPIMPLIGRIDVIGFPGSDFVGTGWFVAADIVVTNAHVASLIAQQDGRSYVFKRGVTGAPFTSSLSTLHEFDDLAVDAARQFAVKEVLYIEPETGPNDIAFLRVARQTDGSKRDRVTIANTDAPENLRVVVVGYPARAPKRIIPNQELMRELYRDRFDIKRAAPGFTMATQNGVSRHDCTTLGGNSGSVVLDLTTGNAVGLHFAGLYQEFNRAVRASVLTDYIKNRRWTRPPVIETSKPIRTVPQSAQTAAPTIVVHQPGVGAVTVTIPLSITVSLGQPIAAAPQLVQPAMSGPRTEAGDIEAAVMSFWDQRPASVIAARVGFDDDGDMIGNTPFIAASVPAEQVEAVKATSPAQFGGFDVRYLPANVTEQIEARPEIELVDSIAYDDDARTGDEFSFEPVDEVMTVRAHVGPEFSWDELKAFLAGANGSLVSAIYDFHAVHIKDAIEKRLKDGVSLKLVMDNVTFSEEKDEGEFERIEVFEKWRERFGNKFDRVVAPEGTAGLISDAYHIKVTVREDNMFWLSSGNWKPGSSQPVITQQQRDEAEDTDLPGNREWHVVINNKALASRFRNHIVQDFKRSVDLGGRAVPKSKETTDVFVDVPIEEAVLERRAPSHILQPREFTGRIKVRPLLTPDKEGEIYSEAVLKLIRSARKSLLFQIPYIGMPSNPRTDRGFIDELIKTLTEKLKTLDDARVILRVGGSKFSAPTHAAWFFKSKGVDINERLRQMEDHHTKGMIVDGKRVLLGSHNWSKSGVTLNRDASLIFDDERIAAYYTEAFEIDWERANPIRPRRFVKEEMVIREAVGAEPPAGYRRVRLSELLKEDG